MRRFLVAVLPCKTLRIDGWDRVLGFLHFCLQPERIVTSTLYFGFEITECCKNVQQRYQLRQIAILIALATKGTRRKKKGSTELQCTS